MQADLTTFGLTTALVLPIYFFTSAPGLGLVDSGELTSVAYWLGIAHPTGYPLYVLLGRIVHLLNTLFTPARAMVLFSVFAGAASAGVLAVVAERVLLHANQALGRRVCRVIGLALALGFAFSPAAWKAIQFAEVYPLSCLIAALLVLTSLGLGSVNAPRRSILVAFAFYLWGVGLGNHMTLLWFAPAMLWIFVRGFRASGHFRPFALLCAAAFALGLSVYLYLPIRSALDPPYDWSDPERIPQLWRHVTAWQYHVWMFTGNLAKLLRDFTRVVLHLPQELGWGLALFAGLGSLVSVIRRNWWCLSLLSVWLVGVLYNLNYDIPDISTYFLLFQVPLFALSVFGLTQAIEWGRSLFSGNPRTVLLLLALIPPTANVVGADSDVFQSKDRFAECYTLEILRTLPDSALVFQANWDIQSPFLYLQDVVGLRQDVAMLDMNLTQRSWYVKQMRRRHPEVFAGCEREADAFVREVRPFESGRPFDPQRIEAAYVAMHNRILRLRAMHRPVYFRGVEEINHPGIGAGLSTIPGGYFLRVANEYQPEPVIDSHALTRGRSTFSDRELMMLADAEKSAVVQGRSALLNNDTSTVRRTRDAVRNLGGNREFARRFLEDADLFLKGTPLSDSGPP